MDVFWQLAQSKSTWRLHQCRASFCGGREIQPNRFNCNGYAAHWFNGKNRPLLKCFDQRLGSRTISLTRSVAIGLESGGLQDSTGSFVTLCLESRGPAERDRVGVSLGVAEPAVQPFNLDPNFSYDQNQFNQLPVERHIIDRIKSQACGAI